MLQESAGGAVRHLTKFHTESGCAAVGMTASASSDINLAVLASLLLEPQYSGIFTLQHDIDAMPRVVPPIEGRTSPNQSLNPSFVESVAGFSAGVVATLVVHPFDILKTRLQLDQQESQWGNSFRILRQIVREEGHIGALYRGILPNMVGNSVSWALYFLWYDCGSRACSEPDLLTFSIGMGTSRTSSKPKKAQMNS